MRGENNCVLGPQIDDKTGCNCFLTHGSRKEIASPGLVAQISRMFREQPAAQHGGIKLPQLFVGDQCGVLLVVDQAVESRREFFTEM
jgi:hypothetical protein